MENTVNIEATKALLPLAAEKDIRFYMNGVYIDFQVDKTIYVATNGHILGVYTEDAKNEHTFNVIVPRDIVKQLKPKKGTAKWGTLVFDPEAKTGRILNPADSQDFGFTSLAGVYPDYLRVIPDKTSGEVGQFDAQYVYAFAQVNKALGASYPGRFKIDHNGERGALVHLPDENFVGVLMPCRV